MTTEPTLTYQQDTLVQGSFFSRVADTTPIQRTLPASRLLKGVISRVREPGIPTYGQDIQDCIPVGSGARYPEGASRCRDQVVDIQVAWLNFNNSIVTPTDEHWSNPDGSVSDRPKTTPVPVSDPITVSEVAKSLEYVGVAAAIHTTLSHTPECPRFAAIIPLAEAVPANLWAPATDWILERLELDHRLESVHLDQLRNPAAITNLPTTPLYWPLILRQVEGAVLSIPQSQIRGRKLLQRPIPEWLQDLNCQRAELANSTTIQGNPSVDPAELLVDLGCQVFPEHSWLDGTRRRTTCPWAREHIRGIGDDCAVIFYPSTGSPVWICGDMCHRHLGIADLIRAKRGA